jgi:hypothetical protein
VGKPPGRMGRLGLSAIAGRASEGGIPDTKFPGGHRSRVTPVPIPNTEVKPATADGTARVGAWESRSLPGLFLKSPRFERASGFRFFRLHFQNLNTTPTWPFTITGSKRTGSIPPSTAFSRSGASSAATRRANSRK